MLYAVRAVPFHPLTYSERGSHSPTVTQPASGTELAPGPTDLETCVFHFTRNKKYSYRRLDCGRGPDGYRGKKELYGQHFASKLLP